MTLAAGAAESAVGQGGMAAVLSGGGEDENGRRGDEQHEIYEPQKLAVEFHKTAVKHRRKEVGCPL